MVKPNEEKYREPPYSSRYISAKGRETRGRGGVCRIEFMRSEKKEDWMKSGRITYEFGWDGRYEVHGLSEYGKVMGLGRVGHLILLDPKRES